MSPPVVYRSTKTWGHEVGLSCAFRQWRATSHCRLLHGYALSVRVEFEADALDERNWVVDFGGLAGFKQWLVAMFDHRLLVAEDDPQRLQLERLHALGLASVVTVPAVGCEAFARMVYDFAGQYLHATEQDARVRVALVEVREHGANSAIVTAGAALPRVVTTAAPDVSVLDREFCGLAPDGAE